GGCGVLAVDVVPALEQFDGAAQEAVLHGAVGDLQQDGGEHLGGRVHLDHLDRVHLRHGERLSGFDAFPQLVTDLLGAVAVVEVGAQLWMGGKVLHGLVGGDDQARGRIDDGGDVGRVDEALPVVGGVPARSRPRPVRGHGPVRNVLADGDLSGRLIADIAFGGGIDDVLAGNFEPCRDLGQIGGPLGQADTGGGVPGAA